MRDVIYHDRPRQNAAQKAAKAAKSIILLAVLVVLVMILLRRIGFDQSAQAEQSLKQNVTQAAVQCYAIEGRYPSDISYLEANYGVSYNAGKYRVSLIPSGDGSLPEVEVEAKKK